MSNQATMVPAALTDARNIATMVSPRITSTALPFQTSLHV